jgi:hypothetical protein
MVGRKEVWGDMGFVKVLVGETEGSQVWLKEEGEADWRWEVVNIL